MEKADDFVKTNGFTSLITMESWMFLSSFEKIRQKINMTKTIINMVHMPYLGKGGTSLGINFGTAAVIMKKGYIVDYNAQYEYTVYYECDEEGVPFEFPTKNERWKTSKQSNFSKIPNSPIAYWVSDTLLSAFKSGKRLKDTGDTRQGMATSDNNRFLRFWHEVFNCKIGYGYTNPSDAAESKLKWFPYNKGGAYRKWYGNQEYVINYENDGLEVKGYATSLYKSASRTIKSMSEYFKPCLSWSKVTTVDIAFRYFPAGFIFDVAGCCIFYKDVNAQKYHFGFLNSNVCGSILKMISPTMNYEAGHIASMPIITSSEQEVNVQRVVDSNIEISKKDWDSFETSWDFKIHPLVRLKDNMKFAVTDGDNKTVSYFLQGAYRAWETECDDRFAQLKANEEELNRIFIDIYGLQDELTPEVEDKDVTVRKADLQRDIKSLISYAVGCMFGRYSPLKNGLLYAGGDWEYTEIQQELMDAIGKNEFSSGDMVWDANFIDKDNIIPICDDEYFDDDIVGRFVKFIEMVYGRDTLEENLKFIADALGGKGQPREVIRNYFLNDFYADHCKIYQKRPIYWLFDSGKKNGFKALIYMHRYQPDTIARIRTDYVHEQQSRYRTAIADMENRIANASTSERVKLNKAMTKLKDQDTELRSYEEKIHHLADQMIAIDLDDGVKVNYAKFQDVLAKIK